jgi:hypothetical protein
MNQEIVGNEVSTTFVDEAQKLFATEPEPTPVEPDLPEVSYKINTELIVQELRRWFSGNKVVDKLFRQLIMNDRQLKAANGKLTLANLELQTELDRVLQQLNELDRGVSI